jgi:RNA polymerase sigma factor FliA
MEIVHDVNVLWHAFKDNGDRQAYDRLVLHYSPLVKYVAGRVRAGLPDFVDQADLVSDGIIGLMDAIAKFDLDRELQFQTYAVPRIRGAIMDGLRAGDWVPRAVREDIRDMSRAASDLERRLERAPTGPEVAAELGLSIADLRKKQRQSSYTNVLSIDSTELGDSTTPRTSLDLPEHADTVPPEFLDAVRGLAERDQIVVALHYWERFTLAEIGTILGVSESRVCQIHGRATRELRRTLVDA